MSFDRRAFLKIFGAASVAAAVSGSGVFASLSPASPDVAMAARGLQLFRLGTQELFAIYGPTGGLCFDQLFYLQQPATGRVLGIRMGMERIPDGDVLKHCREAILHGCKMFDQHSRVHREGEDMGMGIRYPEAA